MCKKKQVVLLSTQESQLSAMINVHRTNSNFFPWVNDPAAVIKKQGKKFENLSDGRTKKKTLQKRPLLRKKR